MHREQDDGQVSRRRGAARIGLALLLVGLTGVLADTQLPTKFSNTGGVINTRHNLTQSTIGAGSAIMNPYRNNYGEVCVYCHTPHGSGISQPIPLWNRTLPAAGSYTTYDTLNTVSLEGTVTDPGPASLSCLSCHDGSIAVDSIINMPGAGNYSAGQESAQSNAFLNTWNNSPGPDASVHIALNDTNSGCLVCHDPDAGFVGAGATDLRITYISKNLTDDHPIGVPYPDPSTRFKGSMTTDGTLKFFDANGNNHADKTEVRVYDSGDGFEVECASCHDPHGVPPADTFLRVSNDASAVCLTCHNM